MPVTATPIYPQTLKNTAVTIVTADASTFKTAYTAGANGSKIEYWSIASTDTVSRDITLNFTISAVNYLISTVSIPLNSGNTNAIAPVNVLSLTQFPGLPKDMNGNPYIYLASGTTLTISATTTVTAAKTITSNIYGEDF